MAMRFLAVVIAMFIAAPLVPINAVSFMIARVTHTPPYLDKATYFPEHVLFERRDAFARIQTEYHAFVASHTDAAFVNTYDTYSGANRQIATKGGGWRLLAVKIGDSVVPSARKAFPTLCDIVDRVPSIRSCMFSVLKPGTQIPIHVGYYKGVIRYQLAIQVPQSATGARPFLCVNGERYVWREGEGVLFDDTYPHKVYNPTRGTRVVIYMDVVRNFNSKRMNAYNKSLIDALYNMAIVKNEVRKTETQISTQ